MVSFLAQNSLPRLKPCQLNIHAASEKFPPKFMAATPVLGSEAHSVRVTLL